MSKGDRFISEIMNVFIIECVTDADKISGVHVVCDLHERSQGQPEDNGAPSLRMRH